MRFVSITPADAGRYYCRASNRYGNSTEMAEVKVNHRVAYDPQPTQLTNEIAEGGTVTLNCDTRDAVAGPIYVS